LSIFFLPRFTPLKIFCSFTTYQRKSKNKKRKAKFISDSSESESDSNSSDTKYKSKSKKIKRKNKSGMVAKASDYVVNPQVLSDQL
jgi:hypothetical protein